MMYGILYSDYTQYIANLDFLHCLMEFSHDCRPGPPLPAYFAAQPLRTDAQTAHHRFLPCSAPPISTRCSAVRPATLGRWTMPRAPVTVGGVSLPHPLILSAGLVKGDGFESEDAALAAWKPGTTSSPAGEPCPRSSARSSSAASPVTPALGNPGTRPVAGQTTRSTQNRIGLRNPGAKAAAAFPRPPHRRPTALLRHQHRRYPRRKRPRPGNPGRPRQPRRLPSPPRPPRLVYPQLELPQHRGRLRREPNRRQSPPTVRRPHERPRKYPALGEGRPRP